MKIRFHKKFEKQFVKLNKSEKQAVIDTLNIFQQDSLDPILKNHVLKGKLKNQRSISAGYDLRLIYIEGENGVEVIFLRVGGHAAVY